MSEAQDDDAAVERFLVGQRTYQARDDDLWVVSYPRSGTTWTLFLAHLLRTRGELDFAHLTDVAPWFERDLALGFKTAADLDALPSPRLFKSHLPFACLPARGRVVYVEREAADVALSYFHLYQSYLDYHDGFDAFFTRFLDGDLQYRSWLAHTRAWREGAADDERVLLLRYEDLQADLPRELSRLHEHLATALGYRLDNDELARVAERGRFDFMKQHEARFDFATIAARESRQVEAQRFLRRGVVGEGRARLAASQQAALAAWLRTEPEPFDPARDLAEFLR